MTKQEFTEKFQELFSQVPEDVTRFAVIHEDDGVGNCVLGKETELMASILCVMLRNKEIGRLVSVVAEIYEDLKDKKLEELKNKDNV